MQKLNVLRLSLLLPFVLPAVGLAAKAAGMNHDVFRFFVWSMVVAGIPYGMLIAVLLVLSVKLPTEQFFRWWLFSPFGLAVLFGPWLLVVAAVTDDGSAVIEGFFLLWLVVGLYCVVIGYVYLAIAAGGYASLKAAGIVRAEADPLRALIDARADQVRPNAP